MKKSLCMTLGLLALAFCLLSPPKASAAPTVECQIQRVGSVVGNCVAYLDFLSELDRVVSFSTELTCDLGSRSRTFPVPTKGLNAIEMTYPRSQVDAILRAGKNICSIEGELYRMVYSPAYIPDRYGDYIRISYASDYDWGEYTNED